MSNIHPYHAQPPLPTLDDLARDPTLVDSLTPAKLRDLARRAERLSGDLRTALLGRLMSSQHEPRAGGGLTDIDVLTTGQLANRWAMPEQKIRDLCRTGKLPAKKLGKEWIISVAALREFMPKAPLVTQGDGVHP